MFKNRALQVKMVKAVEDDSPSNETSLPGLTPEDVNDITKDMIKQMAFAVGGVLTLSVVLNTASGVLLRALEAKN